jgi:hypothetical protein
MKPNSVIEVIIGSGIKDSPQTMSFHSDSITEKIRQERRNHSNDQGNCLQFGKNFKPLELLTDEEFCRK